MATTRKCALIAAPNCREATIIPGLTPQVLRAMAKSCPNRRTQQVGARSREGPACCRRRSADEALPAP